MHKFVEPQNSLARVVQTCDTNNQSICDHPLNCVEEIGRNTAQCPLASVVIKQPQPEIPEQIDFVACVFKSVEVLSSLTVAERHESRLQISPALLLLLE